MDLDSPIIRQQLKEAQAYWDKKAQDELNEMLNEDMERLGDG